MRAKLQQFMEEWAHNRTGVQGFERDVEAEFFRTPIKDGGARFLIATDAAGEGINLNFVGSW